MAPDGADGAERRRPARRPGVKPDARAGNAGATRRARALERQREGKRDALALARTLARVDEGEGERSRARDRPSTRGTGDRDEGWTGGRTAEAGRAGDEDVGTCQPEWMWDDAPEDLRTKWLVKIRPRGTRCLVVSARGKTIARSARDGSTLSTFQSGLPGGSARTTRGRAGDCFCILDCVFTGDERARREASSVNAPSSSTPSGEYHVLDVVAWNGASMYDCETEFRFYWANARLTEECDACEATNPAVGRDFRFVPTPWYECDSEGVTRCYSDGVSRAHGYEIDGLLFYHKEASYETGATPLVLLWRDAKTSAFFDVDEGAPTVLDRAGVRLPGDATRAQIITLSKSADGNFFVTGDDEPVVIAAVQAVAPASECVDPPSALEPGRSARFLVGPAGFDVDVDTAIVRAADVHYLGPKPPSRRKKVAERADALSKILFNARARTSPLSIERLVRVAGLDAMDNDAT